MTSSLVLVLFIFVCWALPRTRCAEGQAFKPKDYPAGKFQVSEESLHAWAGDRADSPGEKVDTRLVFAHTCRAWFEVEKKQAGSRGSIMMTSMRRVQLRHFVPSASHCRITSLRSKEGDYDGRLLLVAKDGTLANLPWRLLLSDYRPTLRGRPTRHRFTRAGCCGCCAARSSHRCEQEPRDFLQLKTGTRMAPDIFLRHPMHPTKRSHRGKSRDLVYPADR